MASSFSGTALFTASVFFVATLTITLVSFTLVVGLDKDSASIGRESVKLVRDLHNLNPLLRALGYSSDQLFETLLMHGISDKQPHLTVIEVGAHRLKQSAFAAECGFNVITFDASPTNFKEMEKEWGALRSEQKDRIVMHNKAVGKESGQTVSFSSIGGTGDHVDGTQTLDEAEKVRDRKSNQAATVSVETISLDDVILSLPSEQWVYLVKIDVQGYEANVFRGMSKALAGSKIRYILFEYWVDALDQTAGLPLGSCSGVTDILEPLARAGYELFDLSVQNHPKGQNLRPNRKESRFSPLEFDLNCQWMHRRSEEARDKIDYSMGYWTDIVAVNKRGFEEEREFF